MSKFLQNASPAPMCFSYPSITRRLVGWDLLTSSPRLGRGLVTGLLADGVRLPLVLGHSGVNLLDDVRADRAQENRGDGVRGTGGRAIGAEDRDSRSGSHFVYLRSL